MIEEIIFAGFGGQGVLLAGKMVAQAAMGDNLNATWFPSYGPEMRGGTANCTVVYSDDEIGSPIASQYDTAVVMNQPSYDRFAPMIKPGGTLVVNTSLIKMVNPRKDITIVPIAANQIAEEVGQSRSANVVIAGAFVGYKKHIKMETLSKVVRDTFAVKGEKVIAPNLKALDAGCKAVEGAVA